MCFFLISIFLLWGTPMFPLQLLQLTNSLHSTPHSKYFYYVYNHLCTFKKVCGSEIKGQVNSGAKDVKIQAY